MFHKSNQIPNKDNFFKPQNKVAINNFRNMNKIEPFSCKNNCEGYKMNENAENVVITENPDMNSNNFMILNLINGVDEESNKDEENDTEEKKVIVVPMKMDTLSTVFVSSISIIALYGVYKAITRSK
tara:strand:+ start:2500 stop:2880 length:381 start_codon:yes stop_codon:yes gene_type:complete